MPRRRAALFPALLAALTLAGCGGGSTPAPVTVTVPAPVPAAVPTSAPAAGGGAVATASWVMPDLVGSGLQAAQDRIQALTGNAVFVTTSHDASGAGRMQVADRNWKVCDQNVAPGARITMDTRIDFGAVKLDERC